MRDAYGRPIDYMRVSVTDRCNLRCVYCMPEDLPFIPHESILRYEEILRICSVAAKTGIKHIKVTGGEPLVRKGCTGLVRELKRVPGIEHVTMTTNAVLLQTYLGELAEIGLDGLNVSLDSLDPGVYSQITGKDSLDAALGSLRAATGSGLKLKINCVPLAGLNEDGIIPISKLALTDKIDVRYIELMPDDANGGVKGLASSEILERLAAEYPDLKPNAAKRGFGPARYYKTAMLTGSIGLIDAVSHRFCSACNRLRLTSEGFLKLCLFHDEGVDLRALLRNGASDSILETAFAEAVYSKPVSYFHGGGPDGMNKISTMSRIGG